MLSDYTIYSKSLNDMPSGNLLITTINAHSYNLTREDADFAKALRGSDVLLPDGISVVWAHLTLALSFRRGDKSRTKLKKIAGEDLFYYEMKRLNSVETHGRASKFQSNNGHASQSNIGRASQSNHGRAFFLGSTEEVLAKIKARAAKEFPCIEVHTYSPPYKAEFSAEDNAAMVAAINAVNPDVLFVGMTAPKQEKWAHQLMNNEQLIIDNEEKIVPLHGMSEYSIDSEEKLTDKENIGEKELSTDNCQLSIQDCHICCIGAVFDFYAGTVKRAPKWVINLGMEWFYRLVSEPKRMWRRYLVGNVKFVWAILGEFLKN